MDCEFIKKKIITDYIDNEMSEAEKILLSIHFADCRECKEFSQRLKKDVVEPFINVKKAEPPEYIWQRLQETISAGRLRKPGFSWLLREKLKSAFSFRKPVFAISTIAAIIFIGILANTFKFGNKNIPQLLNYDEAEYSAYSTESPALVLINDQKGYGTSMEEFFL